MINCATDWTFDKFVEDMMSVNPLPMRRGVHSPSTMSPRRKFCQYIKTEAKYFMEEYSENGTYVKNSYDYIGDAFAEYLDELLFSDWYKDVYNQRPHFDRAFVAMLCDLPVFYEVGFCDGGKRERMENQKKYAKLYREELEKMAD